MLKSVVQNKHAARGAATRRCPPLRAFSKHVPHQGVTDPETTLADRRLSVRADSLRVGVAPENDLLTTSTDGSRGRWFQHLFPFNRGQQQ
jgi:hypothetical protein